MNNEKMGNLIYALRLERGLTQLQLSQYLHISDKTISKWERGLGFPDVEMLTKLSKLFKIDITKLLSGELILNPLLSGNMLLTEFFKCPNCGNIIRSMSHIDVSCCGKILDPLTPKVASIDQELTIKFIENEYFITGNQSMDRKNYISFIAFLSKDTIFFKKLYPEWNLEVRIPVHTHGMLVWYSTTLGLLTQKI